MCCYCSIMVQISVRSLDFLTMLRLVGYAANRISLGDEEINPFKQDLNCGHSYCILLHALLKFVLAEVLFTTILNATAVGIGFKYRLLCTSCWWMVGNYSSDCSWIKMQRTTHQTRQKIIRLGLQAWPERMIAMIVQSYLEPLYSTWDST